MYNLSLSLPPSPSLPFFFIFSDACRCRRYTSLDTRVSVFPEGTPPDSTQVLIQEYPCLVFPQGTRVFIQEHLVPRVPVFADRYAARATGRGERRGGGGREREKEKESAPERTSD